MAVSYTVPNTFSALTVAESAKVNANEQYTKSVFDGLEAGTTTLAKLKMDAVPATSTEVATKAYVDRYATWRRPVLQYGSASTVAVESGLDGTSGDIPILFPDGSIRTETSTTRTTFNITRNAILTTATAQSGLRTSLSEAANTWYALYAVKVTDSSTQWCTVGDTLLPLQSNYSTLNSNFGTNGWVYLGVIRNGDNSGATSDILYFKQSGNFFRFGNQTTGNAFNCRGIRFATTAGATSLTYTTSIGTGTTQVPDNCPLVLYEFAAVPGTNTVVTVRDSTATVNFMRVHTGTGGSTVGAWCVADISEGLNLTLGASGAADIFLAGFYDKTLGVGSNPSL